MANPLIDLYQQASEGDLNQPTSQQWLDYFAQKGMTQGLGVDEQGRAGFSGPVAGYAGPLRPGDVPSFEAGANIPVYNGGPQGMTISPQTYQAREELVRQQNPQLAKAMDLLGEIGNIVGKAGKK